MAMTTALRNFTVVILGENFPGASIKIDDFSFRGRKFVEQLRMGPTLQAVSRNVQLTILPDRCIIAVDQPDDLTKQAQGVTEVTEVFREYVGRRSVHAVGHNMQASIGTPAQTADLLRSLVNHDVSTDLLGFEPALDPAVVLRTRFNETSTLRVSLGPAMDPGAPSAQIDFNFDFNLREGNMDLAGAMAQLPDSLSQAVEISGRIQARAGSGAEVAQ